MEPYGTPGVFVAASANTLNPLHTTDDEGSHLVTESSQMERKEGGDRTCPIRGTFVYRVLRF